MTQQLAYHREKYVLLVQAVQADDQKHVTSGVSHSLASLVKIRVTKNAKANQATVLPRLCRACWSNGLLLNTSVRCCVEVAPLPTSAKRPLAKAAGLH